MNSKYALCALIIAMTLAPTASHARLKPKKPYKVQWTERGNRIDTASVCANYARSSLDYRRCRSYAVDVFKRECRSYRRRYDHAGFRTKIRLRPKMLKFCSASSRFSP